MDLKRAESIANTVVQRVKPYCSQIEPVGSVRRKKATVNDIDFVLIPSDPWTLSHEIAGLGPAKIKGPLIQRIIHDGVQLDFYFAAPKTWATLLLIRTGSMQNNIRLASLAKRKGWHLHASGSGLFNEKGERIAGDSEESIFEALGVPYQRPEDRG